MGDDTMSFKDFFKKQKTPKIKEKPNKEWYGASGRMFRDIDAATEYLSWIKGCSPGERPRDMGLSFKAYQKRKREGRL